MSRLTIIFITIFVDLIGFGIVLPLLPFYAQDFGATPLLIGLLVAMHPAMQFVSGPIWGRISDRLGRRPILLLGLVGSGASYLIFGLAGNLWWLFASRAMAGIAGANIPVAQAYIADSTDFENRTRGMGLVGAAFGLGFIAGPAIGGALSRFGYAVPGFFAAALSLANAGAAYFYLPESLSPELRAKAATRASATLVSRLRFAVAFARRPAIGLLLGIYGLTTLVFSAFTTVFPLWLGVERGYDAQHAGYLFAWFGLLMAIVQGRMLGPSAARVGERRLLVGATALLVGTYALFPLFDSLWALGLGLIPLALGTGMSSPTLTSLASQYGEIDVQGAILGAIQSLSAAARMVGAVWAGWVFGAWGPASPFLANALFVSLAVTFAIVFMIRAPAPPAPRPEPVVRSTV